MIEICPVALHRLNELLDGIEGVDLDAFVSAMGAAAALHTPRAHQSNVTELFEKAYDDAWRMQRRKLK